MDLNRLFESTVQIESMGNFLALLGAAVLLGIMVSDAYRRYFRPEEFVDASLLRSLIILTPSRPRPAAGGDWREDKSPRFLLS